jgi:hypothetical protein
MVENVHEHRGTSHSKSNPRGTKLLTRHAWPEKKILSTELRLRAVYHSGSALSMK